jgi:serine/threonine protein kinase
MSIPAELEYVYNKICQCTRPEQLFGTNNGSPLTKDDLSSLRKSLIKICHTDRYTKNPDALYYASEASSILNKLYDEAVKRINGGVYGKDEFENHDGTPISEIKTGKRLYKIYRNLAEGDYTNVFYAETVLDDGIGASTCIKVIKEKSDNDLLQGEIDVLKRIKHKSLPAYIEDFRTTDGLRAIVTHYIDGSDAIAMREGNWRTGVPPYDWCWMFERFLSILGFLHLNKTLHCYLEPGNLIVRGRDHNGFLIDLIGSVSNPTGKSKFKLFAENYSPPEALDKKPPVPASDLYSLGKCMLYLAGGDVEKNILPNNYDQRLREFLLGFVEEDVPDRRSDAWECWHELRDLRVKIFGAKVFSPFNA